VRCRDDFELTPKPQCGEYSPSSLANARFVVTGGRNKKPDAGV
jgi:hypothetical protein